MGRLLSVSCRECGNRSEQVDGAIMSGFNLRCTDCGATLLVTIDQLVETDPPGIELACHEAWVGRQQRLPAIAGPCPCGGQMDEKAPIRCATCRSTNVETALKALAD